MGEEYDDRRGCLIGVRGTDAPISWVYYNWSPAPRLLCRAAAGPKKSALALNSKNDGFNMMDLT